MANYKKLTDVEVMEEVSESTMALVEDNGKLKKVPCGKGFGGGNGVATAIVCGSFYNANQDPRAAAIESYTCNNMTFEEARSILLSGEPLDVIMMCHDSFYGANWIVHPQIEVSAINYSTPCIGLKVDFYYNDNADPTQIATYWTADGFTNENPNDIK